MNLLDYLPGVPDFPKPGILFRDISPLLANPAAFKEGVLQLQLLAQQFDYSHILGIESRGFIFGTALAHQVQKGLALARKPTNCPWLAIENPMAWSTALIPWKFSNRLCQQMHAF